ncbi:hypothetical protein BpHYR1_011143, partial [Brachionus plicatilis]
VGNFWPLVLFGRWKLLFIGCWLTSNHKLPITPNLNYQQLPTTKKYQRQKITLIYNSKFYLYVNLLLIRPVFLPDFDQATQLFLYFLDLFNYNTPTYFITLLSTRKSCSDGTDVAKSTSFKPTIITKAISMIFLLKLITSGFVTYPLLNNFHIKKNYNCLNKGIFVEVETKENKKANQNNSNEIVNLKEQVTQNKNEISVLKETINRFGEDISTIISCVFKRHGLRKKKKLIRPFSLTIEKFTHNQQQGNTPLEEHQEDLPLYWMMN